MTLKNRIKLDEDRAPVLVLNHNFCKISGYRPTYRRVQVRVSPESSTTLYSP